MVAETAELQAQQQAGAGAGAGTGTASAANGKTKAESEEELKKHQETVNKIMKKKGKFNKTARDNEIVYLEYLSFLISQRLSFLQIYSISKFICTMIKNNEIDVLKSFSFDPELVSLITNCIRDNLKQGILKKLETVPFSFSIDSSVMNNESLATIQVKFFDDKLEKAKFRALAFLLLKRVQLLRITYKN